MHNGKELKVLLSDSWTIKFYDFTFKKHAFVSVISRVINICHSFHLPDIIYLNCHHYYLHVILCTSDNFLKYLIFSMPIYMIFTVLKFFELFRESS